MKNWIVFAVIASFTLNSCNFEKFHRESAEDYSTTDVIMQDLFKIIDEKSQDEGAGRACPNATISALGVYPWTMELDFGTGCTGDDGVYREGKIMLTYSGPWRDAGTEVNVELENYAVRGTILGTKYSVEGSQQIVNNGRNTNGNITYTSTIDGASITTDGGYSVTHDAVRTIEWVEGENTTWLTDGLSGILDDVYHVDIQGSGVSSDGVAYTISTSIPLRKELSCKFITSGTVTLNPDGYREATADFSEGGGCDQQVRIISGRWDIVVGN